MGISVHGDRCTDICEAGQQLIDERNHHADSIAQRCEQLRNKMYNLGELANVRKTNLLDNSAYLQFMWKADVVESWIADKEAHVRSDEFGRDLSSVQTLLTKQETFDIGLRAFETEGIQNISALKEQLISGNHVQAEAINKKFNEVIARWNRLLSDSAGREQRLLDVQDQFRQIEELYLTFAKKASAFNSWFENAEEDMTDPVRCNSIEEIRSLREAHAQFQASLASANADFDALAQLDKQIKSFNVGPNPYTWFTMGALEDTWRNLQKIIKERDAELARENLRQEENDKLRLEFAKHANAFHTWLTETRAQMMEGSGTLEQQLASIGLKAHEVAGRGGDLKKIEDLGAVLEEHLILDNRYTEHSTVGLAQEDRGPRRRPGGAPHPRQPLHGALHRGAGAAVGPAQPAGHAHQAQPRAADRGPQPVGRDGGHPQGVLHDVPPLRQGQERQAQQQRVQVVPPRPRLRPSHGGGRGARAGVRGHPRRRRPQPRRLRIPPGVHGVHDIEGDRERPVYRGDCGRVPRHHQAGAGVRHQGGALPQPHEGDGRLLHEEDEALRGPRHGRAGGRGLRLHGLHQEFVLLAICKAA